MFASNEGTNLLNESSAGVIPINSMYQGEEERQAAIPPPMEHDIDSASAEEQQPETAVTYKDQPLGPNSSDEEEIKQHAGENQYKNRRTESSSNIGKAESTTKLSTQKD